MKNRIVFFLIAAVILLGAAYLRAESPGQTELKMSPRPAPPSPRTDLKLQIFEGLRDATAPATKVVTSSFLKFINYISVPSEETVEQQVRQIYNLKDARLLSEANLTLGAGKPSDKAFHIFRLDGREYLILVTAGRLAEPNQYHLEVYEQGEKDKASLLDMEFNIQPAKSVVLGFEDTAGKPYFMAFGSLPAGARTAGGGEMAPPKLIKSVDPIYPEAARKAGVEGIVMLEATTDIYGRVASVKVLRSIPLLDQAAVDALRQWVYEPAIVNGQPAPVNFSVTVRFTLDGKNKGGGVEGGVVGGVVGGVLGGVPKGVEGGVKGGVEGGVKGGVEGGVVGGVLGGVEGQSSQEADKDSVRFKVGQQPPKLVKTVDPVYPEKARQAQVEGVVILEAHIDEKGNVESVNILRSIPVLDQAAIDAVKQWKYEPLIVDGKVRKAIFTVTVRFMLKSGDKEKDLEKFAQGAVKAEGDIAPPKLVKSVDPVYPEEARKARVQGIVILSAKTDPEGRVVDVMVLRSIPLLNKAAIDAVKQWVYEPLVIDGVAKSVVFTVTVRFQLKDKVTEPQIKKGDVLEIVVKEVPDFDQSVRVSDSGRIKLNLLGDLDVLGQTPGDVEKSVTALLESKYLKVATVKVIVKTTTSE